MATYVGTNNDDAYSSSSDSVYYGLDGNDNLISDYGPISHPVIYGGEGNDTLRDQRRAV